MAERHQGKLAFRFMSAFIGMRNAINPPMRALQEANIQPGSVVLDFGCGPGGHSIAAAQMVGRQGRIYALDIEPLACRKVAKVVARKGLTNIDTICSDGDTGLNAESVDTVLLYDIYHMLVDKKGVLAELHRILKPEGKLSFSDHHMKEEDILRSIMDSGLFRFVARGEITYSFIKLGGVK